MAIVPGLRRGLRPAGLLNASEEHRMTKRTTSKYKLDRRMGENIWGRNKSPISRRAYGPGQHGQRKSRKLSDYGTQLHAKQKLKGYYGNITERQFRGYYKEASRKTGDTGEQMIGLLERRLDSVVFRAKFVPTPFSARQIVNHGHVSVNGKRVNIPSYLVKEGDVMDAQAVQDGGRRPTRPLLHRPESATTSMASRPRGTRWGCRSARSA